MNLFINEFVIYEYMSSNAKHFVFLLFFKRLLSYSLAYSFLKGELQYYSYNNCDQFKYSIKDKYFLLE